jgi:hypothetical protein
LTRTARGEPFLEVPQSGSTGSELSSLCTFWQSFHRARTSVGYCGQGNSVFDNLLIQNSPFLADAIARSDYLADPQRTPIPLLGDVAFGDYAWLYLKANGYRFVVLHLNSKLVASLAGLARLKQALAPATVYEDSESVVYDCERLAPPRNPVMVTTRGWRKGSSPQPFCVTDRDAHLVIYNPGHGQQLQLTIDARSLDRPQLVRLLAAGNELTRWDVRPDKTQTLACRPFHLPAGLHEITLESDSTAQPRSRRDAAGPSDARPYSLKVVQLGLNAHPTVAQRTAHSHQRP